MSILRVSGKYRWNYSPSSFYYHSRRAPEPDLRRTLEALATRWPTYGSRRLTAWLRREGWRVNRKRVQRIMRELGIQGQNQRKNWYTTRSGHPFRRYPNRVAQLEIVRPNQV